MNLSEVIIGLIVGATIGVMDFSLARSMASTIRPSNVRLMQAVLLGGVILRLGLIGVVLWLLSRSSGIDFVAACFGLGTAFTAMTMGHAILAFKNNARTGADTSNRR